MYHDTDREERSSMIEMTEAENDSLGEMTEAEYGVLGEAAEAEYGICDLLDENIPSPLEMDNACPSGDTGHDGVHPSAL